MDQVLLFALLGLGSGALIAGIALAVVLIYRGSGIINIATGGVAMLAGYTFWSLRTGEFGTEFGTAPALLITLLVTLVIGALIELVAFRPLRNAAPLAKLVSSLGVLLVAQASMLLAFGTSQKPQPSVFPSDTVEVFGSVVPVDRFILAGIVIAVAAVLAAVYRWTRFGLATRAASENELSALSWFPTDHGVPLPGVKELVVFLIIVAAMFLRGAALPTRGELIEQRLPEVPRPERLLVPAVTIAVVCAVALVVLPFDFRQALINSMIGTVMALSLVVITGFVGQISVVQLSLAGVAGFTVSHLAVDAGIGFPLAPLAGAAVAVLLGELTAVSALRVRGVSLAVVTLGAAVAISQFGFINQTWGGGAAGSPVPEPHLFGLDIGPQSAFRGLDGSLPSPVFGWLVLGMTVGLCLVVAAIRRGNLGQRMLAVRSNERSAAAAAIDVRSVKLIAFGISSFIAGVAGTLYAYNFGSVSASRFDALTALGLIAFAYVGGITLISGAVFAGLISTQALLPHAMDKWLGVSGNWFLLFGGVILIFTLIQHPEGVAGAFYKRLHRGRASRAREQGARLAAAPAVKQ